MSPLAPTREFEFSLWLPSSRNLCEISETWYKRTRLPSSSTVSLVSRKPADSKFCGVACSCLTTGVSVPQLLNLRRCANTYRLRCSQTPQWTSLKGASAAATALQPYLVSESNTGQDRIPCLVKIWSIVKGRFHNIIMVVLSMWQRQFDLRPRRQCLDCLYWKREHPNRIRVSNRWEMLQIPSPWPVLGQSCCVGLFLWWRKSDLSLSYNQRNNDQNLDG